MKNIVQISLATMAGVAIGALSTFSLFATGTIEWPSGDIPPPGEETGGTFSGNFAKIFTSCTGSGLAKGYNSGTKSIDCMSLTQLRDNLIGSSTIPADTCTQTGAFVSGFNSTGGIICKVP